MGSKETVERQLGGLKAPLAAGDGAKAIKSKEKQRGRGEGGSGECGGRKEQAGKPKTVFDFYGWRYWSAVARPPNLEAIDSVLYPRDLKSQRTASVHLMTGTPISLLTFYAFTGASYPITSYPQGVFKPREEHAAPCDPC